MRFDSSARVVGDPDNIHSEAVQSENPQESIAGRIRRAEFEVRMWLMGTFHWLISVILWLVGWMIYAQYIWGFFTLTVLTVVGPLFVPFMMISQLDFLFWGWMKALLNCVIYMLTASALYAATAMLLIAPLQRMAQAPLPGDPGLMVGTVELLARLAFEYVPLVIMALFAALKVNALSAMIVAGGTPVGSGLGSGLTKAVAGAQWLADRGSGAGAGGGDVPLSTATGQQRAAEAVRDARRRTGGGGGGGGGGTK